MATTSMTGMGGPSGAASRHEMLRGAMAMLPLTLGYLPFGLLLGAAVSASAAPPAALGSDGPTMPVQQPV